ncbi:MAG: DUF4382 domain-containing protein [Caldivirga sp.]|uniref:DUF4382 domain-containing protein n=1 Tax=Caldivirga sp. TaxID=2080243 RepID=UPI003D0C503B
MRLGVVVAIVVVVAVAVVAGYILTMLLKPASVYVLISDKPVQVQHLYVTISSVMLHNEGTDSWFTCSIAVFTLGNASFKVDLASLTSASQLVAKCNPPNGTYNLIFLRISSVQAVINGRTYQCRLPSDVIKVPLEPQPIVVNGSSYSINVDMGMVSNVNLTGNGECIVKPVVRAMVTRH